METSTGNELSIKNQPLKSVLPVILLIAGLICFAIAAYYTFHFVFFNKADIEKEKANMRDKAFKAAKRINGISEGFEKYVNQIAAELSEKKYTMRETEEILNDFIKKNSDIYGIRIGYEPYRFGKNRRLYGPCFERVDNLIQKKYIEDTYDYTKDSRGAWFVDHVQKGPGWLEPYFSNTFETMVTGYSVPIFGPDRKPIGVVNCVCSLEALREFINSLGLRGDGYPFLISKRGVFAYHPNENLVTQSIFDLVEPKKNAKKNAQWFAAINSALDGDRVSTEYKNEVTGQDSWVFFEPISTTGFVLGTVFIKESVLNNNDYINETRHDLIRISFFIMLGIIFLGCLFFKSYRLTTDALWKTALVTSVLLILEITFIWCLSLNYYSYYRENSIKVTDESTLKNILNTYKQEAAKEHLSEPIFVKTGVFIRSIEFDTAYNVQMSGHIWQSYGKDVLENITRGFALPEAVSADSEITEVYRKNRNDSEIIGWDFEVTLRQTFDYAKYPLDSKDVWIKLWPADYDHNVILIPDLGGYEVTDPKQTTGIDDKIVLPGWNIHESFFSYVPRSYKTNFGDANINFGKNYHELYYTVIISREFLNPFISNLLPFMVMAFILFGMLMLLSLLDDKTTKFDSTAAGMLAGCAGLFFSVLIAHSELRNNLTVNGVLYLEYFYFIMYAAIIYVMIDTFLIAFNFKGFFIGYKDNLLPKLLYWPLILSVILAITLRTFY